MTTERHDSKMERLLQSDWREQTIPKIGKETWVTVYLSEKTKDEDLSMFSALIPNKSVEIASNRTSWEFHIGDGHPNCVVSHHQDDEQITYLRFGNTEGVEPFIIKRNFDGIRKSYNEITEEFRHYHRLYHDFDTNQLLKYDDRGDETIVAKIESDRVQVRLQEIRQFLAIKEMHLAIYFDLIRYSDLALDKPPIDLDYTDDLTCYVCRADSAQLLLGDGYNSFSRLLGKKLIAPLPIEKCGLWPFDEEKEEYVDFIIDADENGDPVTYSSEPDKLANYFGANPNAPNYLKPVFFQREVLTKYYAHPERFSVEDGFLRCQGLWGIQIDNNNSDYVAVFLGDLGRDLSYKEQLYWRSYNILPEGKISEVNFKRSFLAEATDPNQIDLVFKLRFAHFSERWTEKMGWSLFLRLADPDQHLSEALRTPLTNSQAEFDSQVLALTKLMIDSLNERELVKALPETNSEIKGSISKFERFLQVSNFPSVQQHIQFLRKVQGLRSASVAHRKGSQYEKIALSFGIKEGNRAAIFEKILVDATSLISDIEKYFLQESSSGTDAT